MAVFFAGGRFDVCAADGPMVSFGLKGGVVRRVMAVCRCSGSTGNRKDDPDWWRGTERVDEGDDHVGWSLSCGRVEPSWARPA